MPERRPPAYLSASRLACYDYCPAEFHKRYVLGYDEPPTAERLFGTAVHKGLEAGFNGQDAELAFLREWRQAERELKAADQAYGSGMTARGLVLLDMVAALNLSGIPERKVTVVWPDIPLPFFGYTDLWNAAPEPDGEIIDFKTTGYGWHQSKADAQIFQPAIYSQAFADEHGYIPRFRFVVMPRIAGPVQVLDGTRTGQQIIDAFDRARAILQAIEAGQFACTCGGAAHATFGWSDGFDAA